MGRKEIGQAIGYRWDHSPLMCVGLSRRSAAVISILKGSFSQPRVEGRRPDTLGETATLFFRPQRGRSTGADSRERPRWGRIMGAGLCPRVEGRRPDTLGSIATHFSTSTRSFIRLHPTTEWASIPDILFIPFHPVPPQPLTVLVLKRLLHMMFRLVPNVLTDGIEV